MDTVTACFMVQPFHMSAFHNQGQQGIALLKVRKRGARMLSADAVGVTQVSLGQLGREKTGVRTAFGRAEFDLT